MKKIINIVIIITLVINLTACGLTKSDSTVSLTHYCLNTVVTITIYSYAGEEDAEDIINECFGFCNHYEKLFSRTVKDSDISKINNSHGQPTEVHQVVSKVINDSLKYSQLSNGAFDITIAPLTTLWNIEDDNPSVPSEDAIQEALKHINYQNISVEDHIVTLADPDAQLDLGGIAKGFIADKLKSYMVSEGVTSAIIDLGGNILTIGGKTSDKDFKIGIKKPFGENNTDYAATVNVSNKSVVTSGIYERYFKENDKLYHHILNTSTGYPVDNNLYSVTIISNNSEPGDALSTTAFALGLKKGKKLINNTENVEAIFITNKNKIVLTDGLEINDANEISFIDVAETESYEQ